MTSAPERLPRVLGGIQAFAIVVGGVVGASIFLVPSLVAKDVPFLGAILAVWIIGAAVTITGVLTLSELAAMLPQAGGGYVYIRAAFGPAAALLFAWTDALMVRAGAAAAISFTFAIYFAQLAPAPFGLPITVWQGVLAIAALWFLAALNVAGARWGANFQLGGTVLKIAALLAAILLPIFLWHGANNLRSSPLWPTGARTAGIAIALVPVLWTYGGWEQLAHLAEEIRRPERNLPRVLIAGMLTVTALYMGAVVAIHYVLPLSRVAASSAVGADLFRTLLGPFGTAVISSMIAIAAVVSANGAVMAGPRSCFAAARDRLAPAWLNRVHPRFGTPANAIVFLAAWSSILIAGGVLSLWRRPGGRPVFDLLIDYVMFGYLGFQAATVLSAIALRRSNPEWQRPFRVPGYPWVPLASLAATLFLMISLAIASPIEAFAGIAIVLSGAPFYWLYRRHQQ